MTPPDILAPDVPRPGEAIGQPQSAPDAALAAARTWIGTPYHHQASVKGVGCDCLGLVRGVYAELYGRAAEDPPAYTRDLAEATGRETLLEAARRHLVEIAPTDARPGDVVIFRLRPGAMAKHCGIISGIASRDACLIAANKEPSRDAREAMLTDRDQTSVALIAASKMIHAFEGAPICEVHLSPWWRRRIAAVFRFPTHISASALAGPPQV